MTFYSDITDRYKIVANDNLEKIIHDVTNISSGTLSTLLHKEGIEAHEFRLVDKIHQKFIVFVVGALHSDPKAYKNWMDAWQYFIDSYDLRTLEVKQG